MTEAGRNTGAPREGQDRNTRSFFRATPEEVKALRMLTLLLICIIFWPTIQLDRVSDRSQEPGSYRPSRSCHPPPLDSDGRWFNGSGVDPLPDHLLLITSFIHNDPSRDAFGGQRRCLAKASRVDTARKGVFDPVEALIQIPHWEYSMHRVHKPEKTGSRRFRML